MATSLKRSDVVKSSDSCDDDHCQPCSFHGMTVVSVRYCTDCEEYLCTKCSAHHKTQKAMRNHTLVPKAESKKSPQSVIKDKCSVECTVHKDKTVKYFCKPHSFLGCSACITIQHKQCNDVDHIPTVAADIKYNDEFKRFNANLMAIEAACRADISDVKKHLKVTETDYGQLQEAMQNFRKQVVGALDKLENKIMAEAGSIMRDEKKKLDDLSKKLSKHQADANAMLKHADTLLSSGKHCDIYFYIKQEAKQLVSLNEGLKRMTKDQTLKRYTFKPNLEIVRNMASEKLICRNEGTAYTESSCGPDVYVTGKHSGHPKEQRFKPGTRVLSPWFGWTGTVVGPGEAGGVCQVRLDDGYTYRYHVSKLQILD